MIIALTGAPRVGKDTFANFFPSIKSYAFAAPIKLMLCAAFDWDIGIFETDEKDVIDSFWHVSPREMMEYVGSSVMRGDIRTKFPEFDKFIGEKIWVKRFEKFYLNNKDSDIIITDLRYKPEFDFLSNLEHKIVRIERTTIDIDESRLYNILDYDYDFKLINDSTTDAFYEKAKNILLALNIQCDDGLENIHNRR